LRSFRNRDGEDALRDGPQKVKIFKEEGEIAVINKCISISSISNIKLHIFFSNSLTRNTNTNYEQLRTGYLKLQSM
jgi:hypothetical protein